MLSFYSSVIKKTVSYEVSTSYSEKTTEKCAKSWWKKKTTSKTDEADHHGEKQFFCWIFKYFSYTDTFFLLCGPIGHLFFTFEYMCSNSLQSKNRTCYQINSELRHIELYVFFLSLYLFDSFVSKIRTKNEENNSILPSILTKYCDKSSAMWML